MEGRPWLRIILIFAGFAMLGLPVWSMTRPRMVIAQEAAPESENRQTLRIAATFSQEPKAFELSYLGKPLEKIAGNEYAWQGEVPPEGIDLLAKAEWNELKGPAAVRIQVYAGESPLTDQTYWTEDELVETVSIPPPTK